jgi:hypothetical protein
MKSTPLLAALPCKHCGCEESSMGLTGDDEIYVQCENLHCLARGPLGASPREAVEKWNANLDANEQPEDDGGELEGVDQVDGDLDAGASGTIVDENGKKVEIPPELEEVARRHAEWDGESPHPYGCDEDDDMPAGSIDAGAELEGVDQVDGDPDAGREALELLRRANNDLLWQGFCGRSSAFNPLPDDAGAELEGVDQVDGDPDDAGAVLEEGTDD